MKALRVAVLGLAALAAACASVNTSAPTGAVAPRGGATIQAGALDLGDWKRGGEDGVAQRFAGVVARRYGAGVALTAAAADLRANQFTCARPTAGRAGDPPAQVCRRQIVEAGCTHTWQAHLWDDAAAGAAAKLTRVRGLYDRRCASDGGLLGAGLAGVPKDDRLRSPYVRPMHDLYHPRIFELAGDIAHVGRLAAPQGTATRVSKICGSTATVDVALDGDRIGAFAIEIEACALGQASASVLAAHAVGATITEVQDARDALYRMLKDEGAPPAGRFWELRHLEGVRAYPQRHVSTLLAFDATLAAIADAKAKTAAL